MRTAASFLAIASATAFAQEIGATDGPSIVSGSNAISAPNVNNGWQAEGSFFSGADGGHGSLFNNIVGSSFSTVNSNSLSKGNIINNPSFTSVSGNDGWTANGDSNQLGPVGNFFGHGFVRRSGDVVFASNHHQLNRAPGFVHPAFVHPAIVGAVYRRSNDVVFANNHHQATVAPGVAALGVAAPGLAVPQFVQPVFGTAAPQFIQPVVQPAFQPVVQPAFQAAPVVAAEQNGQKATVIQNQA
ncbi:hypothetical protein DL89DRAFT_292124 [Linderina pennispora]|uniref:Uncharacterized protein n=1 Tax=Linderina pennispora TaxID=61395 RepID=A0A1Y1WB99_9FUNG|nr:uncharacterized protein DL89DRAFT_321934 [Linderina pennispora]XP_040744021.1 uncharacterized protein DL89DRAFT_292124 [Linderina pennispora]ORX70434.1 hypothetical protein DL89DRAFT_321934 [Linderina pennispora]ORX70442.1 hypothetical protein DL89DRAFT_292124 [Linderina pennispora]